MINLEMPNEVNINSHFSMLIYGKPGVGKTTTALSGKSPVLLDFENGMGRVDSEFWAPRLNVSDYNDVVELVKSSQLNQFETIVIDSMGALIDSAIRKILKEKPKLVSFGGLSRQGFGVLKNTVSTFISMIKNKNKNLIFVAHSKEKDGEEDEVIPNMGAGTAGRDLLSSLDVIGYMDRENGKRVLKFDSLDGEIFTKNSFKLPSTVVVPNPADLGQNTFVQDVIEKRLQDKIEKSRESRKEYEAACEDMEKKISEISNAETCNQVFLYFNNEDKYKKTPWRSELWNRAKVMGLSFNKEDRVFEKVNVQSLPEAVCV